MKELSKINFNDLFTFLSKKKGNSKSSENIDEKVNGSEEITVDYFEQKNRVINTFLGNDKERKELILALKSKLKKFLNNIPLELSELTKEEKELFTALQTELNPFLKLKKRMDILWLIWVGVLVSVVFFTALQAVISVNVILFITISLSFIDRWINKKGPKNINEINLKMENVLAYYDLKDLTGYEWKHIDEEIDEKNFITVLKNTELKDLSFKDII